jgi:hypothetical protein
LAGNRPLPDGRQGEGIVHPLARIAICLGLAFAAAAPAEAAKRVALVVGNNDYANLPADRQLRNAVADARIVRAALEGLGFEVMHGENLGRSALVDRLFDFTARLGTGDTAFFFFAGHGVALSGANYLLPSDIPAARATGRAEEGRLADQAVAEAQVIDRIAATGARVVIVVLDACRNNPLQTADRRSVGGSRGLARVEPVRGVFGIYSAGFGQEALDSLGAEDRHPNSVFTRVFVEKLRTPGLDLKAVATETRRAVADMAARIGHDQFPAYYDQILGGDVYLAGVPSAGGAAPPPAPIVPPVLPPPPDPCAAAETHWRSAETIATRAAFDDHLRLFPTCAFANLARARIAALSAPPPVVTPPAPPPAVVPAPSPAGTWFVIVGSWPHADRAKAVQRLSMVKGRGLPAHLIDSNKYPNLANGLYVVVIGPFSRDEAMSRLPAARAVVSDAYVKSGF